MRVLFRERKLWLLDDNSTLDILFHILTAAVLQWCPKLFTK